jgi:hypothetical protein
LIRKITKFRVRESLERDGKWKSWAETDHRAKALRSYSQAW